MQSKNVPRQLIAYKNWEMVININEVLDGLFFIIGPMEIAEKAKQLLFCYYAISLYYVFFFTLTLLGKGTHYHFYHMWMGAPLAEC